MGRSNSRSTHILRSSGLATNATDRTGSDLWMLPDEQLAALAVGYSVPVVFENRESVAAGG
jgi:hypothetical protein